MSPLPALAISAVLLAAAPTGDATAPPAAKPPGVQLAARCFHYSSKVVGNDRICYYRCGGTVQTTYTVAVTDNCPIFVDK